MRWFRSKRQPQKEEVLVKQRIGHYKSVPENWLVIECGQSPLHFLWYCQIMNFDDYCAMAETPPHGSRPVVPENFQPRRFWAEEHDSFEEALEDCLEQHARWTKNTETSENLGI